MRLSSSTNNEYWPYIDACYGPNQPWAKLDDAAVMYAFICAKEAVDAVRWMTPVDVALKKYEDEALKKFGPLAPGRVGLNGTTCLTERLLGLGIEARHLGNGCGSSRQWLIGFLAQH